MTRINDVERIPCPKCGAATGVRCFTKPGSFKRSCFERVQKASPAKTPWMIAKRNFGETPKRKIKGRVRLPKGPKEPLV